jgi:hypothetical protein
VGALSLLLLWAAGCGDGRTIVIDARDAGGVDAGRSDAATAPDAATGDAAPADAGLDAATSCAVDGVPGVCIHIDDCTGDRAPTPGFCPGPTEIQCCTPRASASCDPDAMPLPNEGLTEEAGSGGCPAGMLRVAGFCVDRFEASLVEIDAMGGVAGSWSPFFNPGTRRVRAVSLRGAVPQGHISGTQAAAACAEAGKRLCTDVEWLRACQGAGGSVYPYGDVRMDGVCNDARAVHPAVEYFGTSEEWIYSMLGHPCLNQLPDSLDRTGEHAGCVSEDGALDMMGNLHEWTADPAGTFRGGFYVDTRINGEGCLYRTVAHDVSHHDYSTGFRCCADP